MWNQMGGAMGRRPVPALAGRTAREAGIMPPAPTGIFSSISLSRAGPTAGHRQPVVRGEAGLCTGPEYQINGAFSMTNGLAMACCHDKLESYRDGSLIWH
jgi:hypothetical protein